MSSAIRFAVALTRIWTKIYTSGLPVELREDRRAEIDCDLWEHQHLASLQQSPLWGTATEILYRFVFGMPADCIWRLETGALLRSEKRSAHMNTNTRRMNVLMVSALGLIALIPIAGIGTIYKGWQDDINLGWMMFGVLPILGSVAIVVGLLRSPTRPALGITLVTGGCLVVAITWFWMFIITIPIGIGLIALAYYRAKQSGWRSGEQSA